MKKLILLLITCLTTAVYGQGFVQNSVIEFHPYDLTETTIRKESPIPENQKLTHKDTVNYKIQQYLNVDSAYLYAGGVLQSIVTNKTDNNASPAGSLGFNFETKRIVFNLFYSYNSRSVFQMDSLYKLGNALLQPNTLGQSFSIGSYCMIKKWISINFRASVSDDLWQINDSTELDASPFLISLGLRFTPFDFKKIQSNKLEFYIDASYTHRSILGDFRNGYYQIGDQAINQGGYNGFDLTANFVFDNLGLFTSYTLNPKDKYLLPGFTGSQVTFGVNLTAKAIRLK